MPGRRWAQVALALVLAVVGGASAIVNALGLAGETWLVVTVAVVGAVVAVPAKVVDGGLQRLRAVAEVVRRGVFRGGRVRVGRLSDKDLVVLGVQAAGLPEGALVNESRADTPIPGYVRRDRHELVADKLHAGQFVVVLGDSAAGKSRLALEAMRATVPGHRLFAPDPGALADTIDEMCRVRAAVLWLDDLDRFFDTDAFTTTVFDRLLSGDGHQRMIVATLRSKAHDNFVTKGEGVQPGALADRLRVLAMAKRVYVERHFTEAEVARAREYTADERIRDALAHARECGLAEYLAVGPQLRDRWIAGKETDPRGAALVCAALDCRRAGYITPLPVALINEVHEHYLPNTRFQDLDAAWHWAKERVRRTTALLEQVGDGEAVVVFDYVLDHVQHTTPVDDDPPVDVLKTALAYTDATTATAIGTHAYYRGRYQLALAAHSRAVAEREEKQGPHHHETLMCRGNRALTLASLGQLDKAEEENRAVLAGLVPTSNEAQADILTIRSNLAFVLAARWKLVEAEQQNRIALEERGRLLGAEHRDTLTSRSYLALVLAGQGKLAEAEAEHLAVLAVRSTVLGADDPSTLVSRSNLAAVFKDRGRLAEAETVHRDVLDARTRVLGPEHPDTLTSRSNLALVLWARERLDDAETENRAVLEILVRVSGPDHPHTLTSRNNLAMVLRAQSKLDEAEDETRAVVDARMRTLGPEHPGTLKSRSNLAAVLRAQGKLVEAEEENRTVLAARLAVLGPAHPDTLISRNNLALVLTARAKFDEAAAEHEKVLAERTRVLGQQHPDTVASRDHLDSVRRMGVSNT